MNSSTPPNPLQLWLAAVNAQNIEGILSLYAPEAVLVPTFSAMALSTPEGIRGYFEKLGARPGLSVTLHERTVTTQEWPNGTTIISGIYCFRLLMDDEPLSFEARFSMVTDTTLPAPILHHHSSQIPRQLS